MKIKHQLFLFTSIVTGLLCLLIALISIVISKESHDQSIVYLNSVLNGFSQKIESQANDFLSSYTQKYLSTKTENIFYQVTPLIKKDIKSGTDIAKDKKLAEIINQTIKIENKDVGYFALLSGTGNVIFAPSMIKELSKIYSDSNWPQLLKIKENAIKNGKASGAYKYFDKKGSKIVSKYASFYKVPGTNYLVGGLINIQDYHVASEKQIYKIKDGFLTTQKNILIDYFNKSCFNDIALLVITLIVIVLIFIAVLSLIISYFTTPLTRLTEKIKKFNPEKSGLPVVATTKTSREIAELATSFCNLDRQIIKHISNYKHELEARHIVEHELQVARKIQLSVLPKITSNFNCDKFSLFAKLISVKEVAGDFYDFFYLDEDNIAIVIADVSGKGIPAAFFMQRATTLIHSYSLAKDSSAPNDVLSKVNNVLCLNNEACMFVTVFLAFYNIKTGKMKHANAGHHETIKIYNDKISYFGAIDNEPALGVLEDTNYTVHDTSIEIGSTLIFYTDGVTDAFSNSNEIYGLERLENILIKSKKLSVEDIVFSVVKDIKKFEIDHQFDDITVVAFKRNQ